MQTIYDFLEVNAQSKADDTAYTYIEDNGEKSQISFNDLHLKTQSIAQYLSTQCQPGQTVVLLFPQGLEYIQAFLGCLYAGVVAVPLYPPMSSKHAGRVLTVIDDCDAQLVLTSEHLKQQLEVDLAPLPVVGFEQLIEPAPRSLPNRPEANQIAFLQYTSGSTGKPKGVIISHGNIVANVKLLQQATGCSSEDTFCNWLPLFHDLGLVNTLLLPIYLGAHSVLMSSIRFIKNPLVWLNSISEFKATICGAPNFGFDHCVERIKPHQLTGVDLSSWRIAFNAAEPIDPDTLVRFSERFSRAGFKESALFSAYGMAEATVFITGGCPTTAYTAQAFSSQALQAGHAKAPLDDEKIQVLISHGQVQAEHHLKIVDPQTAQPCADGQIGEIWFAGPSVAQGYWNDVEKTNAAFGARLPNDDNEYLRTGDLGFINDQQLYISGRIKDVLIIKGRNFYPQDLEKHAYNACIGLNQNGGAAFDVDGKAVLVLEVDRSMQKEFDYKLACDAIAAAIFEQFEITVDDIVFLRARTLSRTSSGKIQRSLTKSQYEDGSLNSLYTLVQGQSEQDTANETQESSYDSQIEAQMCELWQDVFGLQSVSVQDSFLNLGGHSLLASVLIAKIQEKWNVKVSFKTLFTANTVRSLSKVVQEATANELPKILPTTIDGPALTSFAQERMWLVNQIEADSAQYNLSFSLKLFGQLNEAALQQAFNTILTRHQILTTTYHNHDGQILQQVNKSFDFDIPVVNLAELTKAEQDAKIAALSQAEASKLFNLSEDLMLRAKLLKCSAQSQVLLVTVHHIATDGWSLGVLTHELNSLYAAYVHGLDNPLAPLDIQYTDYVYWQRDWLKEDTLQEHLDYWKANLSQIPVIHSLPLDYSRPAVQSHEGAEVHHTLSQSLHQSLNDLAVKHDATLFMLLNAAFASFLSRYSGETDIVIGAPIANREQAQVAPLIGLFINNLVFRSDLSADPVFVDLLEQSKESTLAAYEHQQMPFEKLVDELQPQRDLSHSPLFQVMLNLQSQEMEPLNLPDIDAKMFESTNIVAQYDLTLVVREGENGLDIQWQYATSLFSQATIERMVEHFEVLLQGIVNAPETPVSELPLLSQQDTSALLNDWNETNLGLSQDKCIHHLFEQQVERDSSAVAAVFDNKSLSYGQLNQQANQLAHHLVSEGVTPDSVVGVCVERSLDMLVSVLAIMKSGGAYLPLDPSYPKTRIDYMVADSGVSKVITHTQLAQQFSLGQGTAEQVFCLDDEQLQASLKAASQDNLDSQHLGLSANNLAYLIYTSGSTGNPKGVMLEHHNVTNFLTSMQLEPGLCKDDKLLAVTSLSFDIHVLELYLPLIVGAGVVIASSQDVLAPDALGSLIEEHQITTMQATPSTWKMLVNNDWNPSNKFKALCGGEALSTSLKDELLSRKTIELWNMYGPTETAVWSATQKIESTVSLGHPIANTQCYVLDSHLNPVPIGVAGELYIGGEGVARGYLNQPELTAQVFIDNPFTQQSNQRIYKTGDLVRRLEDGTLEYVRRVDLQVKVRGHRIELGEIEAGLKQHADVEEAVAHVWADGENSNLVAYVVTKNNELSNTIQATLSEHLGASLPGYMVPSAFISLDKIPLTPNGKTDRKALPKPELKDEANYVAPETETEKRLCVMWQELLDIQVDEEQGIGVNSNFFHLGGHSLLGARLVSEIRKQWDVEVSIRTLFEQQTLGKLAKVIENSASSEIPKIVAQLAAQSNNDQIPLSFAQQRLWLIDQIEQGRHQNNLCRGFQIQGNLDVSALTFALQRIVERHQVLRTTYHKGESIDAIQVVNPDFDIAVPVIDLADLNPEQQRQSALEAMAQESIKTFDLSSDLMIRVKLLQFNSSEHVLLVTLHHIAFDGWSEGIIIDELNQLYHAKENCLPALEVQYTDFAQWQNDWLQGDVLERQLGFWKQRLEGLPDVHNLPLDRPRPAMQSYEGLNHQQVLSESLVQGLNALAQKYDVTLFMIMNAAFAVLLSRLSNEDDIVIGTPIANREQAELAPLVGFFVNMLVLRTDLSNNPTFEALLSQCKEDLLQTYEHQQLPFEKLIEAVQPKRSLSYSPLFQVMMVMQNNAQQALELSGLSSTELKSEQAIARYDLTLSIIDNSQTDIEGAAQGLALSWEYATALFDSSTIKRMASNFEMLLRSIIASPQTEIGQLTLLTDTQQQQLAKWNETAADYPQDKCIHQLFTEQAALNPDRTAAVFEQQSLTYQELFDKSHDLALYLQASGVKPGSLVGLCVNRSLDMLVAMLAILQAGGAYVALDPDYPEDRIAHMLEDSQVAIVLTQAKLKDKISVLAQQQTQFIALDEQWNQISDRVTELRDQQVKLQQQVSAEDLAYVIYTSGSTGKSKGVAIEHRSAVAMVSWAQGVYSANELAGVLASTSISFDLSVYEIFLTLGSGGKIILVPNVLGIVELANKQDVTLINTVPSAMEELVRLKALPDTVQTVNLAGEALLPALVDEIYDNTAVQKVYDLYGPSEDTTYTTYILRGKNAPQTIGRPISNTQIHILDRYNNPVPVGVPGEIHVAGAGLARGYLNRPELTDEKFVANIDGSQTRMYKTGDLARWMDDGNIEYMGRIDTQVKVRGFRIEMGEIESQLSLSAQIKDCVVVAQGQAANKQLVAFYVANDTVENNIVELSTEALKSQLAQTLPDYMLPSAFVSLAAIPLMPNGKVDRRALENLEVSLTSGGAYIAPRNDTEEQIAAIWADVLQQQETKISVSDDFFALGGHSLLVIRLASELSNHFEVDITVSSIFAQPTLAQQARLIENAEHQKVPALTKASADKPRLLSYAQQSLWLNDQINPEQTQYNIPLVIELEGELDIKALNGAFEHIIERHEILRTNFTLLDSGDVVQAVNPEVNFDIPVTDLSDLSGEAQAQAVAAHAKQELEIIFNLNSDLMLRARLLKLSAQSHVILVTVHHIASDGWSQAILLNEFSASYRALVAGEKCELPPLSLQYADYACWQRDWLQSDVLEHNLNFWRQKLQDLPEVHNLPLDYSRPAAQNFDGSIYFQNLSADTQKALNDLARKHNVTLFMVLSSAFSVLLSRYSGETDIVFGTPVANRDQAQLSSLVGFFTNVLVIRTSVADNPQFSDLLQHSKDYLVGAYEHQQLPFEKLVDDLQEERNLSYSPLYQVKLALQNNEEGEIDLPNLSLNRVDNTDTVALHDVMLDIYEHHEGGNEAGMTLSWGYATALFNHSTIEQMGRHFEVLLNGIVENPELNIADLPILTQAESQQLLGLDKQTSSSEAVKFANDKCIHELFEQHAANTPDAVAVVYSSDGSGRDEEQLTYGELNEAANQVAHYLIEQDVEPDTLVGICVERSLEMMIAQLGVLKAGGAYVPIDPSYPEDRIEYILDDSGVEIILTENDVMGDLPLDDQQILPLDEEIREALLGDFPTENIDKQAHPSGVSLTPAHLAYVIYTSGSTGQPKGVLVEHSGIVNLAQDMQNRFGHDADTCILQYYSYAFDAGAEDWIGALTSGGTLRLISSESLLDLNVITDVVKRSKVTHLHVPPSVLALLDPQSMPSIKTVEAGGEKYSQELVDKWGKDKQFFNVYGPTETSISSSFKHCKVGDQVMSIGKAIPNVQYYVLDSHQQLCPVGVAGELYIGGVGVGRGYINQPQLTNSQFITNPFASDGDADNRLYRTGDLVRWIPGTDGEIEFVGRIDQQVKIRGFRVELSEIESVLSQHAYVHEVAVIDRDTPKKLVAFFVRQEQNDNLAQVSPSELIDSLRAYAKQSLPDYMIPAAIVALDKLPLTSNGKVDRKALLKIDVSAQLTTQKFVEPKTEVEKQLVEIWQDLLQVKQLGITDNFFSIGGDSILAIQVVNRATELGLNLTTRQLFASQTIEKLATEVSFESQSTISQDKVAGEQGLLTLQRFGLPALLSGQTEHPSVVVTVPQSLDMNGLRQVVSALYQRHDILRLAVNNDKASYVELNDELIERAISQSVEQIKGSLSLVDANLFKAAFVGGEQGQNQLLVTLHNGVMDSQSWGILLQDLNTAIEQLQQGQSIALPAKTASFQQWGERLEGYLECDDLKQAKAYWLAQAAEPMTTLPVDSDASASESEGDTQLASAVVTSRLPAIETQALLNDCPAAYRTQTAQLVMTALYLTLHNWTEQTTFHIDVESQGRDTFAPTLDLTQTLGRFASVSPVAIKVEPAASMSTIIKTVKEQLRAIPDGGVGFGLLRNVTKDDEICQAYPQSTSEISFNYLGQFDQSMAIETLDMNSTCQEGQKLALNVMVNNGQLELWLNYNSSQYNQGTMDTLVNGMVSALSQIIEHCLSADAGGVTPSDFPLADVSQAQLDNWYNNYPNLDKLYPATGMQQGMLYYSSLDSSAYVSQLALTLDGDLDAGLFNQAVNEIISRYDVFRTVFTDDFSYQLVLSESSLNCIELDLSEHDEAEKQRRLEQLIEQDNAQGFDIEKAPLMRITLVRLSKQRHCLIWSSHHALSDGWSFPLVFKDVISLYEQVKRDPKQSLSALLPPVQSFDTYISWLQRQDFEQATAYWQNLLSEVESSTQITLARTTIAQSQGPRKQQLTLNHQRSEQLQSLAKNHQVTLNTVVQGAWAYLLHRYSGEEQVIFGETTSGRPAEIAGVEQMVGLFINSLPVLVNIESDKEIGSWLRAMHQASMDRVEHGFMPLSDIQNLSALSNSGQRDANLFDTLVVFENQPMDEALEHVVAQADLKVVDTQSEDHTNYDLTLVVVPQSTDQGNQLCFELGYQAERFEDETIIKMLAHLEFILAGLLDENRKTLGQLSILSSQEEHQILVDYNDTASDYPKDKCIHELFEQQVEIQPDATAVLFNKTGHSDEVLTYAQLNAKANQVAHYLIEQGVKPDTLVGLCVERSLEMVIGMMAILKAGGAYVPLDPSYPASRLSYMLADSGVQVLLTQQALVESLSLEQMVEESAQGSSKSCSIACLDQFEMFGNYPSNNIDKASLGLQTQHLAYVIYTSGSTGKPKGVEAVHQGLMNKLDWRQSQYQLRNDDRVLQKTPYSFDVSVWEFFWTLGYGAQLVVAEPEGHKDPAYLHTLIQQQEITIIHFVPSMLTVMLSAVDWSQLSGVRYVFTSGEALPKALVDKFMAVKSANTQLFNLYGPTEASIEVAHWSCQENDSLTSVPIGRPIGNVQLYVLDKQLKPVPVGVAGELHIAGDGLARGYLNRPELTKETFIANPFSDVPNARLYKTGDLVRWLPDIEGLTGNLAYIGRIDHQVKVRGFRIELGEIESALMEHQHISESLVVVLENENGADDSKRLVAYVVPSSKDQTDADMSDVLKQHLKQSLPDHMIPSAFVVLEQFPLTPNGKINRKALPIPSGSSMQAKDYVAPVNDIQRTLCEIWQDLLNIEKVGITDNFYAIGGDSILSIQAVSRFVQVGLNLTVRQLYEHQTVEALALQVDLQSHEVVRKQTVSGEQVLIPIQRDFLTTDLIDQHHYNQSVLLKTPKNFTFDALQKIVQALYQRHGVLRMSIDGAKANYGALDDQMAQRATQYHDLSQLEDDDFKAQLLELGTTAKAGFTLDNADVFRAVLFEGKNGQSRLLLVLHHMVVDGVSWRIILEDMSQAFEQWQQGNTIELNPHSSSFQQWGQFLLEHANSDAFQAEKDYWLGQVEQQVSTLPVDNSNVADNSFNVSKSVSFELDATKTQELLNNCTSAYRTQINDLLLSALYIALNQWTGDTKFRVDMEGHGRELLTETLDLTQTVGWFTTVYPVNLVIGESASIADVIKTIKEQLRAIPNGGIGFGLLKHMTNDKADLGQALNGNSEILFNYLGQFDQVLNEQSTFQEAFEAVGEDISSKRQHSHKLELNGMVTGGQLGFSLKFNGLQYEQQTMESLVQSIKSALVQIIDHCLSSEAGGVTPSDFPLSRVNQAQLDDWYQTYPNFENVYATTGMQQGFLFHSSLDSSAYGNQLHIKLEGVLNVGAMKQAWEESVRRHDIFRTVFSDDHAHQIVLPEVTLPFVELDWTQYDESEQQQRLAKLLEEDQGQGFALGQGPLMRLTLIEFSDSKRSIIWTSHHALTDGWSVPLVLKEVGTIYKMLLEGESLSNCASALPAVQPYAGYIDWLLSQDHEAARAYWKNSLENRELPVQINVDGSDSHDAHKYGLSIVEKSNFGDGSVSPSEEGPRMHGFTLTQQQHEQLQAYVQQHQLTVSTVIQGVWAYLLHSYSGNKQVIFGEAISGRPAQLKGVEDIVGMFINTVPVCVDVERETEIGAWLQSLYQVGIDRMEHGFLPLGEIENISLADQNSQAGDGANRSLFNTLVVFDNYPSDQAVKQTMSNLGLNVTDLIADTRNNFGLTLRVMPGNSATNTYATFDFLYFAEAYEQTAIAKLAGHFETVLMGILNPSLKTVSELPLLTDEEQHQLTEWNNTVADYPTQLCIHQLFAQQVANNPDKIAVVDPLTPCTIEQNGAKQLTFKQLDELSRELALYLQFKGVKPDSLVGLCIERSAEMMVGLMGVMQAGGAYVPLDPTYPEDRLTFMLEDSQAAIVITQTRFKETAEALVKDGTQVIALDEQGRLPAECIAELDTANLTLREEVKPNHLAYVIYTSGSTGRPKGVMIEHGMVVDYCYSVVDAMKLDDCETYAAVSTFSSDLGNIALFVPVIFGKTLHVIANEYVNNPIKLHSYIDSNPIDCMKITPSHFEMFKVSDSQIVTVNKALIFAGEPLTKPMVELVNKLNPDCRVFNNYGPTETTISKISSGALTTANTANLPSIYLGKPLSNSQVYILDQNDNPVPVGVPGELHIAGAGVARGYLNSQELTEEKFISDPFRENSRLYRSGDLARWLDDGNIEYLGRIDTQVKIRGFRIETSEIEAKLNEHLQIANSVVVAQGKANDEGVVNKQLVGFYVTKEEDITIDNDEVRKYLMETLPEYMVPMAFVKLDEIPLTSNGKVNRLVLEQQDVNLTSDEAYVAPSTELESQLVDIWAEILNLDPQKVGVNDSFFQLGGHSLLAVLLVSKISKELDMELPLYALFDHKTIRDTAEFMVNEEDDDFFDDDEFDDDDDFVGGTL